MNEQQNLNWIDNELAGIPTREENIKSTPLKMKENEKTIITVVCDKPFQTWTDPNDNKNIKKIIPVLHNSEEKVWWLNPKNPTYREILKKLQEGQRIFTIIQTGTQKNTKYLLI